MEVLNSNIDPTGAFERLRAAAPADVASAPDEPRSALSRLRDSVGSALYLTTGVGDPAAFARLQQDFEQDDPDAIDRTTSAFRGVVRGMTTMAGRAIEGQADLADATAEVPAPLRGFLAPFGLAPRAGADAVREAGQRVAATAEALAPPDPRVRGEFLADAVPEALGQGLTFLAAGAINPGAAGVLGVSSGAASEGEETTAARTLTGGAIGATEMIPIARLFRRLDTLSGGSFRNILIQTVKEGGEEAVQEFIQTAASMGADNLLLGDDNTLSEILGESLKGAATGAVAGSLLGAGVQTSTEAGGATDALRSLSERLRTRQEAPTEQEATVPPADLSGLSPSEKARQQPRDEAGRFLPAQQPPGAGASFSTEGARVGRPELASPATSEEARSLVDVVDEFRKQGGEPQPETFDQWRAAAQSRLEEDYEGEKARLFGAAGAATIQTPEDVMAAQEIVERESTQAFASGDTEQLRAAVDLATKYRQGRTEAGRTLAAGRDQVLTPAQRWQRFFGDNVMTPPDALLKKLARTNDPARRRAMQDEHAAWVERVRKGLEEAGISPEMMADFDPDNPATYHQAIRYVQAARASGWDKTYEYWISSILSSPTTQGANIIGNTANSMWDFTAQRLTEAALNQVPGLKNPDSPTFGEYRGMVGAMLRSGTYTRAWRRARQAWSTESPVFEEELGYTGHTKIDPISGGRFGVSIAGKKGRVIRTPLRALVAMDEMAKSLVWDLEVAAQAHRIAKREKLQGPAFDRRVEALMADPQSAAGRAAYEKALALTFQTELGDFGKEVLRLRSKWKPAGFIAPFVTTPTNILKTGLRKSPLGSLRLLYKLAGEGAYSMKLTNDGKWEYKRNEAVRDIAEQVLAWGALGVLMGLVGEDDETGLPRITGSSATFTEAGRRGLEQRAAPPQSIRVGDTWVSYARIEPLSNILTVAVDGIGAWRDAERGQEGSTIAGRTTDSLLQLVRSKTFLQGLDDIISSIQEGENAVRWAANFSTSWVPNIIKTAGRASDPYVRNYSARGQGEEWLAMLSEKTAKRALPLSFIAPTPRVDLWGREIRRRVGSPATDIPYQMFSPIQRRAVDHNPLDRLILNWNNQNPRFNEGRGFYPTEPQPYLTVKGQRYYMDDDEYNEYLQRSGQGALVHLLQQNLNVDRPTERDIQTIDRVLRRSRDQVKRRMIAEGKFGVLPERRAGESISDSPQLQALKERLRQLQSP